MTKILKTIAKAFNAISPKRYMQLYYLYNRGRLPNLKKPQNISEVILSNIFSCKINEYADYVDKIKVRDLYKKIGYEKHLPKLYGIWAAPEEIDFEILPDSFVLKANNGSGSHYFCRNKKELNKEQALKTLKDALQKNQNYSKLETQYNYISPLVFAEEFIDDGTGELPSDYKFLCLNGDIKCILIVTDRDEAGYKLLTYNINWEKLNYEKPKYKSDKNLKRPRYLLNMIDISKELSKKFDFVRVDFFEDADKLYLGELTFTPAAGVMSYFTTEAINKMRID